MSPKIITYLGIDVCTGPKPVTFVALDPDLKALAIGEGDPQDALAYAAGQTIGALAAVTSPARPNNGRMANPEVRQGLSPQPEPGKFRALRQAEYELIQEGAEIPQTPGSAEHSMWWMKRGFALMEKLETLGYRPYPQEEEPKQWMEVPADAGFWSLLGVNPLPAGTLEGRMQRQLALEDLHLEVPDAMEFFEEVTRFRLLKGQLPMKYVLSQGEINAWIAAYTAWLVVNQPHLVRQFGVEEEGLVFLPCKNK